MSDEEILQQIAALEERRAQILGSMAQSIPKDPVAESQALDSQVNATVQRRLNPTQSVEPADDSWWGTAKTLGGSVLSSLNDSMDSALRVAMPWADTSMAQEIAQVGQDVQSPEFQRRFPLSKFPEGAGYLDVFSDNMGRFARDVGTTASNAASIMLPGARIAKSIPAVPKVVASLGGFLANNLLGAGVEEGGQAVEDVLTGSDNASLSDVGTSMAVATALGPILGIGGKVVGGVGESMINRVDPEKAMIRFLSGGSTTPFSSITPEQDLAKVGSRLREPSPKVVLDANGEPVAGAFDDTSFLTEEKPLEKLYRGVVSEREAVASELDSMAKSMNTTGRYGDEIPGTLKSELTGPGNAGPIADEARKVLSSDRDQIARTIFGEDGFVQYKTAQKRVDGLRAEAEMIKQDSSGIGSYQNAENLSRAKQALTDYEEQIDAAANRPELLRSRRIQYDQLSNLEGGGDPVLTQIANSLRTAEEAAIPDPTYQALKQRESDLMRVEGPIKLKAEMEAKGRQNDPRLNVAQNMAGKAQVYATNLFSTGDPNLKDARRWLNPSGGDTAMRVGGEALTAAGDAARIGGQPGVISGARAAATVTPDREELPQSARPSPFEAANRNTGKPNAFLPRNLNAIDPQGVANLIAAHAPPERLQPLILQWRRIVSTGDKETMAQFLGALVDINAFPDMPIRPGAVTALPSEFDLGDGKARLFSPMDKMKWETAIENSDLSTAEKAQRLMRLRTTGEVVPMNMRLSAAPPPPMSPQDRALLHAQQTHSFAPRTTTSIGSKKMEY